MIAPEGRLSAEQAVSLLRNSGTAELMARADRVRRAKHGNKTYFAHSLNLNPTNVCENRCDLCAFWREPDASDAYRIDLDQARERMIAARGWGLTDLHIVGGLAPELNLAYYESLLRMAGEFLPGVLVQGMTAVEVHYLAELENLTVAEVLQRLKAAGLGAIPGGGAEIFAPQIRQRICSQKISAEQWLSVHQQAHGLGLPTNATMLFGHIETAEDIVDHLRQLREMQDRTGGFQAFIALPFHADGTRLDGVKPPGGYTIARTVALARIFLDNFPHVRVLANYLDRKLLQALTHGGADDVGGTSLDERIARAAGAPDDHQVASVDEMKRFLADLGLQPILVNSAYEPAGVTENIPDVQPAYVSSPTEILDEALAAAQAGQRLSACQAIALHDYAPFQQLGAIAHKRRCQTVSGDTVTFVIDRNISITNICQVGCRFCAFGVKPGSDKGFALSIEQIVDKVVQAVEQGATQIMLQGGLNPDLDLGFYEKMFVAIKQRADVWIHSLSPAEVYYLAGRNDLTIAQTLERLGGAGLDSLPGGGAEILVEAVRQNVSPDKITAAQWFEVMETAHSLGMKTTATMVYGLGETTAQRIEHLMRLRELQDRTGGFTAFIPWSFQPNHTRLSITEQTGVDYLRIVALARLVLDNVPHIQAGWVTEGPDLAIMALEFGCDDFGGVLMEENVIRATGVGYTVNVDQIISLIQETGMTPAQRTTQYETIRVFS